MHRTLLYSLIVCTLITQSACDEPPQLDGILSRTAYPRQILAVEGSALKYAGVVWDAGLDSEQFAQGSFLSARYFQVPIESTPGSHPVRLSNSEGESNQTLSIDVLPSDGVFPSPRIEDVGIRKMYAKPNNTAGYWLSLSVANGDPDGQVMINKKRVLAKMYSAIPIDFLLDHTPSTFGYPVYHYSQYLVMIDPTEYGEVITVEFQNGGGEKADLYFYKLPDSAEDLDSDGDGLKDSWEENGYPAPSGTKIDLKALGCDPLRKDILIEVDWVAVAECQPGVWTDTEEMFARAPVLNPDGSRGINAIIDRGQGGVFTEGGTILSNHSVMDFPAENSSATNYVSFYDYKNDDGNFDPDRLSIFHYGVIGRDMSFPGSGRGEIWGNDFMVGFTSFSNWGNQLAESGTLIHELGHNLGLRHGGISNGTSDANRSYKPNFPSLMNYHYQFRGVSDNCDIIGDGILDYSQGMLAPISESVFRERMGICDGRPIDINCDGDTNDSGPINVNVKPSDCGVTSAGSSTELHRDYDQWGDLKLQFTAAASDWKNN